MVRALTLEPIGEDRFAAPGEPGRFDRAFGGQLVAQAVAAAGATVAGKVPQSIHASFVAAGSPGAAVELVVDRVRDGRSFATRRVSVLEDGRELLAALVSFHDTPPGVDVAAPPPPADPPETLPSLEDWARRAPAEHQAMTSRWVEVPPAVEMRMAEPPTFFGGPVGQGPRSHWMRLARPVDDAVLDAALLAYASDYFLLDMAYRSHPDGPGVAALTGVSLDHAVWFHRPVRFERWHLYTQSIVTISGQRALVQGSVHDPDGRLVATVAQEALVRPHR
nr:acyl-CoA thioesterase domain-containing protein [Rhabdothermincola salaria]